MSNDIYDAWGDNTGSWMARMWGSLRRERPTAALCAAAAHINDVRLLTPIASRAVCRYVCIHTTPAAALWIPLHTRNTWQRLWHDTQHLLYTVVRQWDTPTGGGLRFLAPPPPDSGIVVDAVVWLGAFTWWLRVRRCVLPGEERRRHMALTIPAVVLTDLVRDDGHTSTDRWFFRAVVVCHAACGRRGTISRRPRRIDGGHGSRWPWCWCRPRFPAPRPSRNTSTASWTGWCAGAATISPTISPPPSPPSGTSD